MMMMKVLLTVGVMAVTTFAEEKGNGRSDLVKYTINPGGQVLIKSPENLTHSEYVVECHKVDFTTLKLVPGVTTFPDCDRERFIISTNNTRDIEVCANNTWQDLQNTGTSNGWMKIKYQLLQGVRSTAFQFVVKCSRVKSA
ncbi:uncharacterized protein LOC121858170 [Homarus americanus]|nr:uncharacterized protein LOC121858170 [Homarus americanus]